MARPKYSECENSKVRLSVNCEGTNVATASTSTSARNVRPYQRMIPSGKNLRNTQRWPTAASKPLNHHHLLPSRRISTLICHCFCESQEHLFLKMRYPVPPAMDRGETAVLPFQFRGVIPVRRTAAQIFGTGPNDHLLSPLGEHLRPAPVLDGKVVGVYYAKKDQACDAFTKELIEVYLELREQGKPFEIVFVSGDVDGFTCQSHSGGMPWPSLPFDDSRVEDLKERLALKQTPMLAMLEASGRTLNPDAVWRVQELGADGFPWTPDRGPVRNLTDESTKEMQVKPAVVLLCEEQSPDMQRSLKSRLNDVAKPFADTGVSFYTAFRKNEASKFVREYTGVRVPCAVVLVDQVKGRKYLCPLEEQTEANVPSDLDLLNFIRAYAMKELEPLVKSAPRPLGDMDPELPHCMVVVRDSFGDLILENPATAVLLCVHEGVQPDALNKVGSVLAALKVPKVKVARMGADKNDIDWRSLGGPSSTPLVCLFRVEEPVEGDEEPPKLLEDAIEDEEDEDEDYYVKKRVLPPVHYIGELDAFCVLEWLCSELGAGDNEAFDMEDAEEELSKLEEIEAERVQAIADETFLEMYNQIEADCGDGVTRLELVAALCDAGGVPTMQAEGMADDLLKATEAVDDGDNKDGTLQKEEWLSFWDGMKQLSPTGQHDIKMLSELRWSLGMPPLCV